jgi:hypothetical protein
MPELRETYYTATDAPKNISRLTIEMLAYTLAKVFRRWQHTMPHYHFTEELLRRICQLALAMYEEENG